MVLAQAAQQPASFNTAFYSVTATVIPVLFLAIVVQGGAYENLIRRGLSAAGIASRQSDEVTRIGQQCPLPVLALLRSLVSWLAAAVVTYYALLAAGIVLLCGAVGEGAAILAVARQESTASVRDLVIAATFILLLAVIAGRPLTVIISAARQALVQTQTPSEIDKTSAFTEPESAAADTGGSRFR